jgi:hypothetical protein
MMVKVNIDLWILIICMAIPSLCLIITFFLIFKKRSKSINPGDISLGGQNSEGFEDQVAFQVACQQLNLLILNTINELEKHRLFLQGYMTKKTPAYRCSSQKSNDLYDYAQQIYHKETEQNPIDGGDFKISSDRSESDPFSSYQIISDLFQSGMTAKQIAEKINFPQAEIDLYLKLHFEKDQNLKKSASSLRISA